MILEAVILPVKPGQEAEFEAAFAKASLLIAGADGYHGHELQRCLETPNQYLLMVYWENLEAHMQGFRNSDKYQEWRQLLHHFYDPFPTVLHYTQVYP